VCAVLKASMVNSRASNDGSSHYAGATSTRHRPTGLAQPTPASPSHSPAAVAHRRHLAGELITGSATEAAAAAVVRRAGRPHQRIAVEMQARVVVVVVVSVVLTGDFQPAELGSACAPVHFVFAYTGHCPKLMAIRCAVFRHRRVVNFTLRI